MAKRPNDPRIPETLRHIRLLARRQSGRPTVQDYLAYRAKHAPQLPSTSTLYRLFDGWQEALAAAGVSESGTQELSRTPDEELINALKEAAKALGVTELSSHAYDDYRRQVMQKEGRKLPSSSVIRKWLGHWATAVKKAGLESPERTTPRRATIDEVIEALRSAKQHLTGMMSPRAYNDFRSSLPDEEREKFPEISQIVTIFPDWEAALRAADVEQSDSLHPTALWTAEEARRIARQAEKILGRPLDEEGYERIRASARKPMPEWHVMHDLLSL